MKSEPHRNGEMGKTSAFQLWANMKMDLAKNDDDLGIPVPDNGDKDEKEGAKGAKGAKGADGAKGRIWGRMAHVLGKSGINIHLAIIKAKPHTKYSNEQHFYLNRGQGSSLRSGPSWKFGICQKFG